MSGGEPRYARIERGNVGIVFRVPGPGRGRPTEDECERDGIPIAIRATAHGFWTAWPGVTDARFNTTAQWTRSLEELPLASRKSTPLPVVLVRLVLPAKVWRGHLGHEQRERIRAVAGEPEFPDDGTPATAVLGPLEEHGTAAETCQAIAGECGVRFREVRQ